MENPKTWTKTHKVIHKALYHISDMPTAHNVISSLVDHQLLTDDPMFNLTEVISQIIIRDIEEQKEGIIGLSLTSKIYNKLLEKKIIEADLAEGNFIL